MEAGETRSVALMMGLAVSIGLARMLVYTAAYGLFLDRFESTLLPWVYVLVAGLATAASALYLRAASRVSFRTLLVGAIGCIAAGTVALRVALDLPVGDAVIFLLPVWYEVMFVVTGLAFWALAGRLFNLRQGKRLFGLLGTGDTIAEIGVGFATPLLVKAFGAANLLALAAGALALGLIPLIRALRLTPPVQIAPSGDRGLDETDAGGAHHGGLRGLLRSRYLVILIAQILMTWVGYYGVDLIFYDRVEATFTGADATAGFVGVFFGAVAVVALLGQSLLTPRILGRLGVRGTILVLPLVLLATMTFVGLSGTLGGPAALVFVGVAIARFCSMVLMGVTDVPATLLLYQPLPAVQRVQVQGIADGMVYPVAVGAAGLLLVFLQQVLGFGPIALAWSMVLVVAVWIVTAIALGREYPVVVRRALSRRLLDDDDVRTVDETSLRAIEDGLGAASSRQVLYSLEMLARLDMARLRARLPALLSHGDSAVLRAALARAEADGTDTISTPAHALLDRHEDSAVRAAALRALCARSSNDMIALAAPYVDDADRELGRAAIIALLRYGGIAGVLEHPFRRHWPSLLLPFDDAREGVAKPDPRRCQGRRRAKKVSRRSASRCRWCLASAHRAGVMCLPPRRSHQQQGHQQQHHRDALEADAREHQASAVLVVVATAADHRHDTGAEGSDRGQQRERDHHHERVHAQTPPARSGAA